MIVRFVSPAGSELNIERELGRVPEVGEDIQYDNRGYTVVGIRTILPLDYLDRTKIEVSVSRGRRITGMR